MLIKKKRLRLLKIISLIIFSIIARNTPHVIIPMIIGVPFISFVIFIDFMEGIMPLLSLIGVILVLIDINKKKDKFTVVGYMLSYIILIYIFIDITSKQIFIKELYFLISSSIYIALSVFIMINLKTCTKNKFIN